MTANVSRFFFFIHVDAGLSPNNATYQPPADKQPKQDQSNLATEILPASIHLSAPPNHFRHIAKNQPLLVEREQRRRVPRRIDRPRPSRHISRAFRRLRRLPNALDGMLAFAAFPLDTRAVMRRRGPLRMRRPFAPVVLDTAGAAVRLQHEGRPFSVHQPVAYATGHLLDIRRELWTAELAKSLLVPGGVRLDVTVAGVSRVLCGGMMIGYCWR